MLKSTRILVLGLWVLHRSWIHGIQKIVLNIPKRIKQIFFIFKNAKKHSNTCTRVLGTRA